MFSIEEEGRDLSFMVRYYCKKHHNNNGIICEKCNILIDYAQKKLALCKYGNKKPTCLNCTIHCYSKEYRNEIRIVMRYCGPRMIFINPLIALRHIARKIFCE